MSINRAKGPKIKDIQSVPFQKYERLILNTGTPIYLMPGGTQPIVKTEFVFYAGRSFENKQSVSKICHALLREGTTNHSGQEIAEKLDYYGATLSLSSGMDTSSLCLYCLEKHFESILPLIGEIINTPIFQEDEIHKYINRSIHSLEIELSKNEVVAYRLLTENIFGKSHPYGYNSTPTTIRNVSQKDLEAHFKNLYVSNNMIILVSGRIPRQVAKLLETIIPGSNKNSDAKSIFHSISKAERVNVEGSNDYQSAIRVGRPLFNRQHQDYVDFYMLNTIFGGYFGSRLMKKVREEKGYTYGIYSSVDPYRLGGFFSISTEVDNKFVEPTLRCIEKEMELLKTKLISDDELKMVRNYILGNFLSLLDGPMKSSQMLKVLTTSGLDEAHLAQMMQRIREVSAHEIREMAIKYFNKEEMHTVVVGKK